MTSRDERTQQVGAGEKWSHRGLRVFYQQWVKMVCKDKRLKFGNILPLDLRTYFYHSFSTEILATDYVYFYVSFTKNIVYNIKELLERKGKIPLFFFIVHPFKVMKSIQSPIVFLSWLEDGLHHCSYQSWKPKHSWCQSKFDKCVRGALLQPVCHHDCDKQGTIWIEAICFSFVPVRCSHFLNCQLNIEPGKSGRTLVTSLNI